MKAKKIYNSDIEGLLISSLPTRPTLSYSRGGAGYSASDMKAAFDKLPLLIIEKYNNLIDDVHALGDGSLASDIPTGIKDGHTLGALFEDLASGELATYFNFLGKSLFAHVLTLWTEIDSLKARIRSLEGSDKEDKQ